MQVTNNKTKGVVKKKNAVRTQIGVLPSVSSEVVYKGDWLNTAPFPACVSETCLLPNFASPFSFFNYRTNQNDCP